MDRKDLCLLIIAFILADGVDSMSKQQLKNSGKMFKKQCMGKNKVTEDEIGEIDKGRFVEQQNVMCYIACIYQMSQVVKNNKLNYEASLKQIDIMYPPELKDTAKGALEACKDIAKKNKDLCEASYKTAKCMYEYSPKDFLFP